MAIAGSPKVLANDIAEGFQYLNQNNLKKYTPADLKIISNNLDIVLREIRGERVDLEDTMAVKRKNMRAQRINQALMVLRAYCKQRKIPI
ncbi:MAG: hypothetical protein JSU92_12810 [Deltaproteobacteria bacterium]|nr:MAG: hypothetical protein JSU92_12810 [Deltaproteobacteria bacterium]